MFLTFSLCAAALVAVLMIATAIFLQRQEDNMIAALGGIAPEPLEAKPEPKPEPKPGKPKLSLKSRKALTQARLAVVRARLVRATHTKQLNRAKRTELLNRQAQLDRCIAALEAPEPKPKPKPKSKLHQKDLTQARLAAVHKTVDMLNRATRSTPAQRGTRADWVRTMSTRTGSFADTAPQFVNKSLEERMKLLAKAAQ